MMFSGSHALAWESILDAPASRDLPYRDWTQARPEWVTTPARGNQKNTHRILSESELTEFKNFQNG
jgi:hypothetical protein